MTDKDGSIYYVERWGQHIYIMRNYRTGGNTDYDFYKYNGKNYRVEKGITFKEFKNAISSS